MSSFAYIAAQRKSLNGRFHGNIERQTGVRFVWFAPACARERVAVTVPLAGGPACRNRASTALW